MHSTCKNLSIFFFSLSPTPSLSLLGFLPSLNTLLLAVLTASMSVGLYLAYILYFVLEDFCVVCTSMYVINALLLLNAVVERCRRRRRGLKTE